MISISTMMSVDARKKAYRPSIVASSLNYLVGEGAINSGTDLTFINLSNPGERIGAENGSSYKVKVAEPFCVDYRLPLQGINKAGDFWKIMDSDGDKYMRLIAGLSTLVILMICGCKKPYEPTITAVASNYLVVEGTINTETDSTSIRLSRTIPLSSIAQAKPELGATVTVLTDAGGNYPLSSTGDGYYTGVGPNLNSSAKYGLKITTSDGKVYESDFVSSKNSPPIDSVYYQIQSDGVKIYADTHDPSNSTTYYRWDYKETYEIHSAYYAYVYFSPIPINRILNRPFGNQITVCWLYNTSLDIVLNSSAKLAKDVIANNRVTAISSTSEKLRVRYSILVKQYALTADAFHYYEQLKKNTEQLGSIFDAQSSELPGNIHCVTSPGEAVIGYITAGSPAENRLYIDNRSLPAWRASTPYDQCKIDTFLFARKVGNFVIPEVDLHIYSGEYMPLSPIQPPGSNVILGYTASSPECVDCTLRGSNKQPDFWTN